MVVTMRGAVVRVVARGRGLFPGQRGWSASLVSGAPRHLHAWQGERRGALVRLARGRGLVPGQGERRATLVHTCSALVYRQHGERCDNVR